MYEHIEIDEVITNVVTGARIKDIDDVIKEAKCLADETCAVVKIRFPDRIVKVSPAPYKGKPKASEPDTWDEAAHWKSEAKLWEGAAREWKKRYHRVLDHYWSSRVVDDAIFKDPKK